MYKTVIVPHKKQYRKPWSYDERENYGDFGDRKVYDADVARYILHNMKLRDLLDIRKVVTAAFVTQACMSIGELPDNGELYFSKKHVPKIRKRKGHKRLIP